MNKLILVVLSLIFVAFVSAEFTLFDEEFYSATALPTCRQPKIKNLGETCGLSSAETNFTSTCQIQGLTCNSTSNVCEKISAYGKTCTSDKDCSGYSCIANKCGVKLGYGEPCTTGVQCYSGMCSGAGKCIANIAGGNCTDDTQCKFFGTDAYFCHPQNKTCTMYGAQGQVCDASNLCNQQTSCVSTSLGSAGTCQPKALPGAQCDLLGLKPMCAVGSNCVNGTCILAMSSPLNGLCITGDDCAAGLACNMTAGAPFGRCAPEAKVSCDTTLDFSMGCKTPLQAGYCNCVGGVDKQGVCATNSNAPQVLCATQYLAFVACQTAKCNFGFRGDSFPYLANGCYASNCKAENNALNCCLKSKVTGWVATPEFTDAECVVPKASSPKPKSSIGGASTVAISTSAAVIASIVALLA